MTWNRAWVLPLTLLIALTTRSMGAEIRHTSVNAEVGFITVRGQIEPNDGEAFLAISHRYERAIVLFESPGGSLTAGLDIGETVRAKKYVTGVAPGTLCASACALAWLGGIDRYMAAASRIGFHAAYTEAGNERRTSGVGNALVGAYLNRLGLPTRAVVLIAHAEPHEVSWLTPDAARIAGIKLNVLEVSSPQPDQRHALAEPSRLAHFVTGLDPLGDNWLALKAAPDIRSRRLAKLASETPLNVVATSGSWLNVELQDGRNGWVASRYVGCCRR